MEEKNIEQLQDFLGLKSKILLGPGPTNIDERVRRALSEQTISHLDPDFFNILDNISDLLREVFQTKNKITFAVSGTGSAGMEMAMANVLEKEDKILVLKNGVFGERMSDVASRYGASVIEMSVDWGQTFDQEKVVEKIKSIKNLKAVSIVHAETSTGALQGLSYIGNYLKTTDVIFIVDTVTSLSGIDVKTDDWNIDVCYSGTQKCLSVPPGLSPITFSNKALNKIQQRTTKIASWYLDLTMLINYWGSERVYHHTAPINMLYALNEGLSICHEEGLDRRFARHKENGDYFDSKLEEMGIKPFIDKTKYSSLPMLKSIFIPDGIDDSSFRQNLLLKHNIEIGSGLGPTKGKIWRIGVMGHNSRKDIIDTLFNVLGLYLA
ncbi:MAG: alanine--glyoxylate aminotransferase family protein [Thermodesulfobacteriota bacterium]|nr:alanine--glyoxylate aminotransferase family protein [Thermodesulfobacteriota bacterium]